jgi:hypothetical protein
MPWNKAKEGGTAGLSNASGIEDPSDVETRVGVIGSLATGVAAEALSGKILSISRLLKKFTVSGHFAGTACCFRNLPALNAREMGISGLAGVFVGAVMVNPTNPATVKAVTEATKARRVINYSASRD